MTVSIRTCRCLGRSCSSRITRRRPSSWNKKESRKRGRRKERGRRTLVLPVRVRPHQRRQKERCQARVTKVTTRIFLITRKMGITQCMLGKHNFRLNFNREIMESRYVVLKKLGWGHFSTVWLAFNLSDKKIYALKILKSHKKYLDSAFDEEGICKIIADNY